jgi:uncharacterized LabA/DUF88 family protein
MDRVAVFLDYQNVYKGARDVFFASSGPASCGNVWPLQLGKLLLSKTLREGELVAVHVYRGLPDANREPRGNTAARRQQVAHEAAGQGLVLYHHRPLRYPRGWPNVKAQEKGVDVALAMDFASMAGRDYDLGILFSTDTDLRPALEAVMALPKPYPRCAVAAWQSQAAHSPRLSIPGAQIWCYWLNRSDFDQVVDTTVYAL